MNLTPHSQGAGAAVAAAPHLYATLDTAPPRTATAWATSPSGTSVRMARPSAGGTSTAGRSTGRPCGYEPPPRDGGPSPADLTRGRPPFWGELGWGREATEPFRPADDARRFLASGDERPFLLTTSTGGPHFPCFTHFLPPEHARAADAASVGQPANSGDDFAGKPPFHGRPWWPCVDTIVLDEAGRRRTIAYRRFDKELYFYDET